MIPRFLRRWWYRRLFKITKANAYLADQRGDIVETVRYEIKAIDYLRKLGELK